MKHVVVTGYAFDCLPGHIQITARGEGSNLRVAICDAIRKMLSDERLHRKRLKDFKMSAVMVTQ
jgi:hypothetical protein